MRHLRTALLVLAIAGAAGWLAWSRFRPPEVTLVAPTRGPAIDAVYATGLVEPSLEVRVAPRTGGRLAELRVDEGDVVRPGQLLARLEDDELRASVAELEARAAFAQAQHERNAKLRTAGLIAQEPVDRARSDLDAAGAVLRRAREQLGYTRLVAPTAGRVIRRDGEVGEYVAVNQVLFYLAGQAPLRVAAEVDEEDVPRIRPGLPVMLRTDAFPDRVFDGTVAEITPRGDPVSRSYRVRIALVGDPPLQVGMTTEANIVLERRDGALLVPAAAVVDDAVFLVERGRAVARPVRVGVRATDRVEILDGLAATERVVAAPPPGLREGARLEVRPDP